MQVSDRPMLCLEVENGCGIDISIVTTFEFLDFLNPQTEVGDSNLRPYFDIEFTFLQFASHEPGNSQRMLVSS